MQRWEEIPAANEKIGLWGCARDGVEQVRYCAVLEKQGTAGSRCLTACLCPPHSLLPPPKQGQVHKADDAGPWVCFREGVCVLQWPYREVLDIRHIPEAGVWTGRMSACCLSAVQLGGRRKLYAYFGELLRPRTGFDVDAMGLLRMGSRTVSVDVQDDCERYRNVVVC